MMKKKNYTIAVLPGDGIGPEVINETYKILDVINNYFKIKITTQEYDIGGVAIDKTGIALPSETIKGCKKSHAVLLGSVGGPKWKNLPNEKQPERGGLLPLRKKFNLFCNLRPAKLYSNLSYLSPLRRNIISDGFDILCIRELTGGIYFGQPKGRMKKNNETCAFDTEIYFKHEIERIAILAFNMARKRKNKITSVDKANVLESSTLWREIVTKIAHNYPDVTLEHLYIDNAVMQIIKNPNQFDVILCSNLFGDILSDECAMITGSIGLLPSASINENKFGIYEPAGGSAPDIQGQNIANPIAQILSLSMLIKYSINQNSISRAIDSAVKKVLHAGYKTIDLTNNKTDYVTTNEMGSKIADFLIKGI